MKFSSPLLPARSVRQQQMIVLTRRFGESLLIEDNIKITIEKIGKSKIRLCIEAPEDVVVSREEEVKEINK